MLQQVGNELVLGGLDSNREIAVAQSLTCGTQLLGGGRGTTHPLKAVLRHLVLAVVAPRLFILHLAIDKASVLSLGRLVLTVGRIDFFAMPRK